MPPPTSEPTTEPPAVDPGVPGLEDDEAGARLVAEELKLLKMVHRALEAAAANAATKRNHSDDARLLELRDDVAVAKPEDLPALFEQMHNLGALRAQRGKGVTGTVDRASPYFGHLRLEENGKRRDVLIGARSYVDSAAGIRIVDWRQAPVSRIYYRYAEEDDYEEILGDRNVDGKVLARRSVAITGGELVRVASPQGTFVRALDGRWRRTATREARLLTEKKWARPIGEAARLGVDAAGEMRQDKHLPAIASLLDAAQFELIAQPSAGLVAVQGSAGSGKTTVGLHRVAYLAFADPSRFRADRMMVVVPHEALVHYVARVLPSLGVEGVPVTTFGHWGQRIVNELFPKLPSRISDDTPAIVARAKSHPAMLRAVERVVQRITVAIDARIREAMSKWPEGSAVVLAWEKALDGSTAAPDARITALAQWVAGKRTIPGAGVAASLPDVTRGALERLGPELRSSSRAVAAAWDELLTNRAVWTEAFAGAGGVSGANEIGFGPGKLDQAHEWCVRQARVRAEGERDGEMPSLDQEDHALLLRTWQLLRGPLPDAEARPIRFAHLFIDEVQDASPVELRVLLDLTGKERSVTLAGDTAQRMLDEGDDRGEFDWNRLLDELEVPHTTVEPLRVSYRSTREITTFARKVLGPLAHEADPVSTRSGPPVELFTFASPGETVAWLADALKQLARDEPDANVALVARFAAQAEVYFEGLTRAEVPNVRRVGKQDFTWEAGVDVTDIRQTKGLEFDEVVLLETTASSYPPTPQARHAMYVGATRAAHQLWCVASDSASALVTDSLESVAEDAAGSEAPAPAAPPDERA
jgi:DNA helicase-2/ATP-dependent DNA helicase PcrA